MSPNKQYFTSADNGDNRHVTNDNYILEYEI